MLLISISLMLALAAAFVVLAARVGAHSPQRAFRRLAPTGTGMRRTVRKPAWVRKEVMRLKALLPRAGCRAVADCFNRRFAERRKVTVGKTFVSDLIRTHGYEIKVLRRGIRRAKPRRVPRNLVWALDLTGKGTLDGSTRMILGILEHASRAALWLEALESKSSWRLINRLIQAIRRYGKPRLVRTDNEAVFASKTFRLALLALGIRHQRSAPHSPWENGRVERFFGTLKESLDRLAVDSLGPLQEALREFRFFYNHVRPHQNLAGATPAEAWAGIDPFKAGIRNEYWFEAWDGLLCGYYLRR